VSRGTASLVAIGSACLALATPALAEARLGSATVVANRSDYPQLFAAEFADAKAFVDRAIASGIDVPLPKDPGGGYTHEQHKRNYRALYLAGKLYALTGDRTYSDFARDMLFEYAKLYPTLGDHPARANQNTGRLFWQVLNDAVWQVYAIQGYANIRDTLDASDRAAIDNLFRASAKFLSEDSARTFNLIHNHATWATAGVGMTGYLLGDRDMVERALLGSDKSGKTGFLRQVDLLFSPDGYYAEGPYYQRYALMPFMVFADAIERNEPERGIFERRDGVLLKALDTTIQLTYDGYFFPFNDALKDKSLRTDELYQAVAIGYAQTKNPGLLSIGHHQDHTVLTEGGLQLAADLAAGKAQPFAFRSLLLRDGPDGKDGAVAVLREGSKPTSPVLVAKNSSQGMGHGHFDKLSWQFYDNGHEIVTDYGAARFLNIEAKEGGRYLPENETWAKQTIAHNTLTVNGKSNFNGDQKLADLRAPTQLYFAADKDLQVTSARLDDVFPDEKAGLSRTLAIVEVKGLEAPVVVDVLRVRSEGKNRFELPLHYAGHIMDVGFPAKNYAEARPVLGRDNGYQHIWVDAVGIPAPGDATLTWLLDDRFYTYRFVTDGKLEAVLATSGANDPHFNLRREPMIIQRLAGAERATFVSVLEPHGLYDGAAERTVASRSQIASLRKLEQAGSDLVVIETVGGKKTVVAISYDPDPAKVHSAKLNGRTLRWKGFAARISLDGGND
jgi:hypothetical protein